MSGIFVPIPLKDISFDFGISGLVQKDSFSRGLARTLSLYDKRPIALRALRRLQLRSSPQGWPDFQSFMASPVPADVALAKVFVKTPITEIHGKRQCTSVSAIPGPEIS